jgi:OPT oligopeptide transporter protein
MPQESCVASYLMMLYSIVKIPPRVMVVTQVWGTLLGAFVNYAVMSAVTQNQRKILLDPIGTNIWSMFFETYP